VPHPFCWIGLSPRLFDAPSRHPKLDLDWAAHSFLCVPDGDRDGFEVHALLGFAWGFTVRDEEISLVPPTLITPAEWAQDVDVLAPLYPSWRFVPGFRTD
jgi:hypothetical protein